MAHGRDPFTALRAVLGGDDHPQTVEMAIRDETCAILLACSAGLSEWVHAIAAARGGMSPLIPINAAAQPEGRTLLIATIAHFPQRPTIRQTIGHLAAALPVGALTDQAETLCAWVDAGLCNADDGAALIGASALAARLLQEPCHAASAIRRWGASASVPTAWVQAVGAQETQRLIRVVQHAPTHLAAALPFLPDYIPHLMAASHSTSLSAALDACLTAPQQKHMDPLIDAILALYRYPPQHIPVDVHVRLFLRRPNTLPWLIDRLQRYPFEARVVCEITPWSTLPEDVQNVIRAAAARSRVCSSICAARGERPWKGKRTEDGARAFFAALDRNVWERLVPAEREAWLTWIHRKETLRYACRTLGPRLEILGRIALWELNRAAQGLHNHGLSPEDIRHALLPVACRDLNMAQRSIILSYAATNVPDPIAFAQIVSDVPLFFGDGVISSLSLHLADAVETLALLRTGDIRAAPLLLNEHAPQLPPPSRVLLIHAIPPHLLVPGARAELDTLDNASLVLLSAALSRRTSGVRHRTDCDSALALLILTHEKIARLLAPHVRAAAKKEMPRVLRQLARDEICMGDLTTMLKFLGRSFPQEAVTLAAALARLTEFPNDTIAQSALARIRTIVSYVVPLLDPELTTVARQAMTGEPMKSRSPRRQERWSIPCSDAAPL